MVPSTKPYLLRAIYEWCSDNGFAPYLAVSVDARTRVPVAYVKDGEIVLNVGPDATQGLTMGNEEIRFQARFNGAAQSLVIPVDRVTAIYARESGQGMAFEVGTAGANLESNTSPDEVLGAASHGNLQSSTPVAGKPHLTRIK